MKQIIDAPSILEVSENNEKDHFNGSGLKSVLGIKCFKDEERNALSLSVPVNVLKKIRPGEAIYEMIKENFSLGAKEDGDDYIIAFPKDTSMEKIQEMVDEIEERHIKLN